MLYLLVYNLDYYLSRDNVRSTLSYLYNLDYYASYLSLVEGLPLVDRGLISCFIYLFIIYNLNYYIYLDNVRSTLSYLYDSTSLKLRFLKEKI